MAAYPGYSAAAFRSSQQGELQLSVFVTNTDEWGGVCRIQQYLRERQAREDEEAARKAGKKEVADRIYERLKGQAQAEAAAREEEDRLVNLLHAEEEAERARRSAVTCCSVCCKDPTDVLQHAMLEKCNHGLRCIVHVGQTELSAQLCAGWKQHVFAPHATLYNNIFSVNFLCIQRTVNKLYTRLPINTKLRML